MPLHIGPLVRRLRMWLCRLRRTHRPFPLGYGNPTENPQYERCDVCRWTRGRLLPKEGRDQMAGAPIDAADELMSAIASGLIVLRDRLESQGYVSSFEQIDELMEQWDSNGWVVFERNDGLIVGVQSSAGD